MICRWWRCQDSRLIAIVQNTWPVTVQSRSSCLKDHETAGLKRGQHTFRDASENPANDMRLSCECFTLFSLSLLSLYRLCVIKVGPFPRRWFVSILKTDPAGPADSSKFQSSASVTNLMNAARIAPRVIWTNNRKSSDNLVYYMCNRYKSEVRLNAW